MRLARDGWDLCLTWVADEAAARRTAARCEELGAQVALSRTDVSREDDVLAAFERARALGPISGLVNNAGILGRQSSVADLSAERVLRTLRVNVVGAFLCCRQAVHDMRGDADGGRPCAIVNVSSRAAVLGAAHEYVDYAASKAALDALTVGLSKEVAPLGIRVNGVRPALIDTDIHASGGEPHRVARLAPQVPLGRSGRPDEVASVISWLLSEDSSYVTGSIVDVGGGL